MHCTGLTRTFCGQFLHLSGAFSDQNFLNHSPSKPPRSDSPAALDCTLSSPIVSPVTPPFLYHSPPRPHPPPPGLLSDSPAALDCISSSSIVSPVTLPFLYHSPPRPHPPPPGLLSDSPAALDCTLSSPIVSPVTLPLLPSTFKAPPPRIGSICLFLGRSVVGREGVTFDVEELWKKTKYDCIIYSAVYRNFAKGGGGEFGVWGGGGISIEAQGYKGGGKNYSIFAAVNCSHCSPPPPPPPPYLSPSIKSSHTAPSLPRPPHPPSPAPS